MTEGVKITKRAVDALKVTGTCYVAWDTDVPGFGVRVGPTGSKTHVLKYRVGGGRGGRMRWGVIGTHGDLSIDSTTVRAHRSAHGGKGGRKFRPSGARVVGQPPKSMR